MKTAHTLATGRPSFRRKPESRGWCRTMGPGFRRDDEGWGCRPSFRRNPEPMIFKKLAEG